MEKNKNNKVKITINALHVNTIALKQTYLHFVDFSQSDEYI